MRYWSRLKTMVKESLKKNWKRFLTCFTEVPQQAKELAWDFIFVCEILKKLNGTITIQSAIGVGTAIELTIPQEATN